MTTPAKAPSDDDPSLVVAVARLETKVEALQEAVRDFKVLFTDLKGLLGQFPTSGNPGSAVPVTGGVAGLAAALWTLYAQVTGKG